MTNIAEGFARYNRKEFYNFLNIAQASLAEVVSLLYICLDQNFITSEDFSTQIAQCENIRKLILNLMKYLSSSPGKSANKTYSIKEPMSNYDEFTIPADFHENSEPRT
ncbi:MAG: four helix bundle protein [Candidatus Neomarinimicrobiota bacterium]